MPIPVSRQVCPIVVYRSAGPHPSRKPCFPSLAFLCSHPSSSCMPSPHTRIPPSSSSWLLLPVLFPSETLFQIVLHSSSHREIAPSKVKPVRPCQLHHDVPLCREAWPALVQVDGFTPVPASIEPLAQCRRWSLIFLALLSSSSESPKSDSDEE